jgi:2'-5' RNA ligase
MSTTARLFVALWPDARTRAALASRRDAWQWSPAAVPVRADKLHATLHFLGNVAAECVEPLRAALAVPFAPFELVLRECRLWNGGIAVLEVDAPPPALLALHARLADALRTLDLPVETRPYRPHVTLGRKARGAVAPLPSPLRWTVHGYALVVSAGGEYAVMQAYP